MTDTNSPAGAELRARREALSLSRHRFATIADCSPNYLATLEGGFYPQESSVLLRVIAALEELEAAASVKA